MSSTPMVRANTWSPWRIAFAIALVALVYGVISSPRYGVTFDEPSLFYAGDRTLFWIQHHRDEHALAFNEHVEPAGFTPAFERSPEFSDPTHYPVLPALIAAVTSRIFHDWLHWVDVVDGHQIGLVLIHSIGLFFFCIYLCRLLGILAGAAGTIALAMFPEGLASSFNNAKDWPCVLFFAVAVLALANGFIHSRTKDALAGGVFLGLSFAAKLQAIFVFPTMILWLPVAYLVLYYRQKRMRAAVVGAICAAPYIAGMVFFISWPWLWASRSAADRWDRLSEYLHFMISYGGSERTTWTSYPFRTLLYMTPPIVLLAGGLYVALGWRRHGRQSGQERTAIWWLLVVWCGLPLIRIAAPHSNFYGANRHFFEYIPALCAMAGGTVSLVVSWTRSWLERKNVSRVARRVMAAAATMGGLGCLAWPIIAYRPYELMYFNVLAGGLGRAQVRGLLSLPRPTTPGAHDPNGSESDWWFTSLRDALRHVRSDLSRPGATMGFCGPWPAQVKANRPEGVDFGIRDGEPSALQDMPLVYVAPQGNPYACSYGMARDFERERPILWRVEREGGIIFEIVGRRDGKVHPVVTKRSVYDTF